jgi:hypothetical protein
MNNENTLSDLMRSFIGRIDMNERTDEQKRPGITKTERKRRKNKRKVAAASRRANR